MNLVLIAAYIVVCGAAKLDRTYLPPSSADSAGGSPGSLQAPLTRSSGQASLGSPIGSYNNNFEGVVVDAASPGTRSSGDASQSGLGGPRPSYGSSDSKVGDAAFRGSVAGFHGTPSFDAASSQNGAYEQGSSNTQNLGANGLTLNGEINAHTSQGLQTNGPVNGPVSHQPGHAGQFSNNFQGFAENKPERPQSSKDRNSNILSLSNDVNSDSYSYGFETDNGIAVGENGVAANGIQAEGGYSYQGDDGQVYKVTYTADAGGYRPQGAHLPTPPPIPDEILKSLEQNAKEEAAGLVDDGSYDAQKYNAEGDYTHDNSGNTQHNGAQFGIRPNSNTPSVPFNQNIPTYGKPGQVSQTGSQFGAGFNTPTFSGHSTQANGIPEQGIASGEHIGHFGKPSSGQSGTDGSLSTFNGESTHVNRQPGSALFGSQISHSTFGQSSHHFNSNPGVNSVSGVSSGSQSSTSSEQHNGHDSLTSGQILGQNTGHQFSSLSQQLSGASANQAQFGSQFGQQTSAELLNQLPESNLQNQPSSQFGSNPSKPSSTHGGDKFQSAQSQFESSFNLQGSEAFSGASLNQGQNTQYNIGKPVQPTFSGQNINKPSENKFNRPTFGQGQTYKGSSTGNSFNKFPQASSQGGSLNDYLPPFNANSQSQSNKFQSSGFPLSLGLVKPDYNEQNAGQKEHISGFGMNEPKPASALTSFDQHTFQQKPGKPLNEFNTPQSMPNKFTQQQTSQFAQSGSQFNVNSQFSSQSILDSSLKPTAGPNTDSTTSLGPNMPSAPHVSQFSSQTTSSYDSSGSVPSNIQTQTQFGLQGVSAFGQSSSQTLLSNFPTTASHINSSSGTTSTQNDFQSSVEKQPEITNGKPQITENSFGLNQQNQGINDSYFYNQPSTAFGAPSVVPQGSRFPSESSQQSNGVGTQNQFHSQQSHGITNKFFGSPSPAPVGPTTTTQFAQTQGYSGITQAAISPFPSVSPTTASQYGMVQNSQFGSKPSFNQQSSFGNHALSLEAIKPSYNQQQFLVNQAQKTENQETSQLSQQTSGRFPLRPIAHIDESLESQTLTQSSQPELSDSTFQQQATQSQQYQGTIYQYNKPAEVLPVPQKDSSSSQSIQAGITSDSKLSVGQPQENQLSLTSSQQNSKPVVSFGNQNKPIGSTLTQGQLTQADHGNQISQQTSIESGSQQTQFNTLSSNTPFSQSTISESQSAKPFGTSTNHFGSQSAGSNTQGIQSFQTKPQYDGQTQSSQTNGNLQLSQPERGSSSQTYQNSGSSQSNGYFYPKNPNSPFGEVPQTQFNHHSQLSKPHSNQFNHNTHLGNSQTPSFFNRPSFNFGSTPQHAQSQKNQTLQATFVQHSPNSPIHPYSQPHFGQSIVSSQAIASGQATASASASTSPQQYKPFDSQNTNQFGQKESQDGEQTQFDAQNVKPGIDRQSDEALNKKPENFGSSQGSKPLFNSACCKGTKDPIPAPSANRPNQATVQGTQDIQSHAGKGEQFVGPRQPQRFDDQTGYHY